MRRPNFIKRFKKPILEFVELQSGMAAADRNPLKRGDISLPREGCISLFLVKSVLRFRASSDFGVPKVAIVSCTVHQGL